MAQYVVCIHTSFETGKAWDELRCDHGIAQQFSFRGMWWGSAIAGVGANSSELADEKAEVNVALSVP